MQPVYGPSTPSPYQQFYDVTTGLPIQPQLADFDATTGTEARPAYQRNPPRSTSPYGSDDYNAYYGGAFSSFGRHSPASPYEAVPRAASSPVLTMEDAYARLVRDDSFSPTVPTEGCKCVYCAPPPMIDPIPNPPVPTPSAVSAAIAPAPPPASTSHVERSPMPHPAETEMDEAPAKSRTRSSETPKREARRGKKKSADRASPSASQPSAPSPKTEPKRMGTGTRAVSHIVDLLGHHDRTIVARSPMDLAEGDYVVFEGDRGIDMGRVHNVSDVSARPDVARPSTLPMVIRSATTDEIKAWTTSLPEESALAVPVCQEAVDRLGIRIVITGASYQLDRQKLTFFYDSPQRVDFRRLLSPMFTKYRCRIWLERNE